MRRLSTLPDPVQDGGPRLRFPASVVDLKSVYLIGTCSRCIKATGANNGHRRNREPRHGRASRFLGHAAFGGTADSVALWFKSLGHEDWFYYYLTGMIGISLMVYLFMRDTKADSAMHRHE
jgi:hypothetical protein